MTDAEITAQLMEHGDLRTPASPYGRTTSDCIPFAVALVRIIEDRTGEEADDEAVDHAMGLVVNGHPDVEDLIMSHGTVEQQDMVREALGLPVPERSTAYDPEAGW